MGEPSGEAPPVRRSGFVVLAGRPNVGKSTLLNALVGRKVAPVARVPQTTRRVLRGVRHSGEVQVVLVDTPGLHKPRTELGRHLNRQVIEQLSGVDLAVVVVDAAAGIGAGDRHVAGRVAEAGVPAIGVLNKLDLVDRPRQLPLLEELAGLADFDELVPVSARTGEGVDVLARLVEERMPPGPPWFPEGQATDADEAELVGETIREQAIEMFRDELPHSIAVVVDEIAPGTSEGVVVVRATVHVERESQKPIVIGRGGERLRDVGRRARERLEPLLGARVWLDLRVKVTPDWQRDAGAIERLGL